MSQTRQKPPIAAQVGPTREALLARVPEIASAIAEGAAQRDIDRELPFEAFRLVREAGLGALRVPAHLGGPGGSVADYIGLIADLGAADSNVAHALRSHFNFTEMLVLDPDAPHAREHIALVLQGKLFGAAHTELGTKRPGEQTATLTRSGVSYRLNGRKWYATGTAFSDYAWFSCTDEEGRLASVFVPLDRPGIAVLDDWDGMGQRLTASGGVILDDVEVFEHEISIRVRSDAIGRHTATLRQLHLAASAAGAVRAALRDGIDYVQQKARTAMHSTAETARDDPFVLKVVGEIAARSFAVDSMIAASAAALDRTAEAIASGDERRVEAALVESARATASTQIVMGDLALKAAEQIFELGGGTATSRKYNLDRHWRNIRTVLNHNPLLHKARVVGDYLVNGTTTHLREGRVF